MIYEFKAGDLVYYPSHSPAIYKLEENPNKGWDYPLVIKEQGSASPIQSFTAAGGERYMFNHAPSIFHATIENKKLLDSLYGIEFEEPSKTLYEKMEEHFDKGGSDVLCTPLLWNTSKLPLVVIQGVHASFGYLIDNTGEPWVADGLRVLSSDEVNQYIWSEQGDGK